MGSPLSFSFELFPPRTPEGVAKLPAVINQLAAVRPNYFSVTYGAGGSDQDGTYETLVTVARRALMLPNCSIATGRWASSALLLCAATCRLLR
jgi:5,10-methylenetetrahydrofolate reductase